MSTYDLVIRGGKVANTSGTSQADVGIRDGRIAALGLGFEGREVIDATGKFSCPAGSKPIATSRRRAPPAR